MHTAGKASKAGVRGKRRFVWVYSLILVLVIGYIGPCQSEKQGKMGATLNKAATLAPVIRYEKVCDDPAAKRLSAIASSVLPDSPQIVVPSNIRDFGFEWNGPFEVYNMEERVDDNLDGVLWIGNGVPNHKLRFRVRSLEPNGAAVEVALCYRY